MKANERFYWAVDIMDIQPRDQILEIGCGTGIAVGLIAERLKSGKIIAIDQSEAMIKKAVKRNHKIITEGKAIFIDQKLDKLNLTDLLFDKVFAFNVSVFWKDPVKELEKVKSLLKPTGTFYLFHLPPFDITRVLAGKAREQLENNGFQVEDTIFEQFKYASAFCIISNGFK